MSADQSLMVDPLSYYSFQPVLYDWLTTGHDGTCYPLCGDKRPLAANRDLRLLPTLVGLLVLHCTHQCRQVPHPLIPYPLFFLSRTEEQAKACTCVRDRRALQQLALNVHVKHSDLTGKTSPCSGSSEFSNSLSECSDAT